MINLFNINDYIINTSDYSNLLHDSVVSELENSIASYVGAKYAVTFNSATSAIFLALLNKKTIIDIPSIIPPVVINAISTSGNKYRFVDNISWVGNSYILHDFGDYKIVDSAQKLSYNQFKDECNSQDLMVFSFYPTKPVGSCDGGMIVSNDLDKISFLREMSLNGMSYSENNWDRKIKYTGYKMYMNSIQCSIALNNFRVYENKINRLGQIRDRYNSVFCLKNNSNHLYRINIENRDIFIKNMKQRGICVGIHYEASHLNPLYNSGVVSEYPLSEIEGKTTISIPFNEKLTDDDVEYIIKSVCYEK